MKSSNGYVLSTVRYGDSDAVLHCFTEDDGFQSFFCRGLFSPRRKGKIYIQPLSEISFSQNLAGSRGIKNISKIELLGNGDIPDVKTGSIQFFLADFLNIILRNEGQNESIYKEIGALKKRLLQNDYHAHLFFMVRALLLLGLAPLQSKGRFINLEEGTFEDLPTHSIFDENISQLWKSALAENPVTNPTLQNSDRRAFLSSILLYYQVHFPGFRTPVSLDVVSEIFA